MAPRLLRIVLGVALIVAGLVVVPYPGLPAYGHHVEQVPASTLPDDASVASFDSLSPAARSVVRSGLAGDGNVVVHASGDAPPDWAYRPEATDSFVRYEGSVYRVKTRDRSRPAFDLGLFGAFVVAGLRVATVGARERGCDATLADPRAWVAGGALAALCAAGLSEGSAAGVAHPTAAVGIGAVLVVAGLGLSRLDRLVGRHSS